VVDTRLAVCGRRSFIEYERRGSFSGLYAKVEHVELIPSFDLLCLDAGNNTVNTDNYSVETLSFTYMNAGYTGYYMNCGPEELDNGTYGNYKAADDTLTATVVEIMPDELIITRYSAEGIHPLGWQGEADPYKGYIDAGLIGEEYYSKQVTGPVRIERKHN